MSRPDWEERIRRARELAAQYPSAAQVLDFCAEIAAFQKHVFDAVAAENLHRIPCVRWPSNSSGRRRWNASRRWWTWWRKKVRRDWRKPCGSCVTRVPTSGALLDSQADGFLQFRGRTRVRPFLFALSA